METIKKDNGVICGTCETRFESNDAYLNHVCSVTGFTPRDPEHFGSRFMAQSKKALERTKSLTPDIEKTINTQIKNVKDNNIDDRLMRAAL